MSGPNVFRDPFKSARERAKRSWGSGPRDHGAPAGRTFPEHVIHACLAWSHRLRMDQRGERRLKRSVKIVRSCVNRWPELATRLGEAQQSSAERAERAEHAGAKVNEEQRRLWIVSILSAVAVVAFLAIEYGFAQAGLDLFLENPNTKIGIFKISEVGAIAIALVMAAAAELVAHAIRGVLANFPRWLRRLLVVTSALALPVAFVLPFLSLREEAADLGASGVPLGLPNLPLGVEVAPASGSGDDLIPFLVLGLAPVLVGAVLRAASSTPQADRHLRERLGHRGARLREWARRRRFSWMVRRLDRAELRIARVARRIARREARDEAGRIVDRLGYRFTSNWYGWLDPNPEVVDAVVLPKAGTLPGAGSQEAVLDRFAASAESLRKGGPVRQRLESEFGNPLAGRSASPEIQLYKVTRSSGNNHHSEVLDG
jgi:hypothetical protein